MIISLIGYMGSGKSHISKILSQKINFKLIDLDKEISSENNLSIPEIFEKRGEIYFRKEEKRILEKTLSEEKNIVLSLGGGTPAYYDNMETINNFSKSIFLRTSIATLTKRVLLQKELRPLIARLENEEIPEFIAKHLFERNPFYSKAHIIIDTDHKTAEEICIEILEKINF